jgi:hypothetical protein
MANKINIDHRYPAESEIRTSYLPYKDYFTCLVNTFNQNDLKRFCDVGCATGHLICFLKNYLNSDVKGYEYFKYHKDSKYCHESIKQNIEIYDIRDSLPNDVIIQYC